VKVIARRHQGFVHAVDIEDGAHTLLVDEPPGGGGTDAGPSPTRLLAASLASCIAITVEMYAERKEWELGPVEVAVESEYDGFVPTSFRASIQLPGPLSEEQRKRLLAVADRCPVSKALTGETSITVSERVASG
jgi:putative redox protein